MMHDQLAPAAEAPTVPVVGPTDVDARIGEMSTELGYQVYAWTSQSALPEDLVDTAKQSPGTPVARECGQQGAVAVCFGDSQEVVYWYVPLTEVGRSQSHAKALLAWWQSRDENKQLETEVESLVGQVTNDFEELNLVRTLATSVVLPNSYEARHEIIDGYLPSVRSCVGAESVAAVVLDANEDLENIVWSGEQLLKDDVILDLTTIYRDQSESQPVVQNKLQDSETPEISELTFVECRCEGRLYGWLVAFNRVDRFDEHLPWAQHGFTTVQASVMETTANQLAAQLHNLGLIKQKEDLLTDMVRALVNALDARDPYTCGHSERVAAFGRYLGGLAGLSPAECEHIYLTGLLHDVGKIAIPDQVLLKPSKLTEEEREVIETHTEAGWRILHELGPLQDVLKGVLYHHENYNGTGYPDKLAGESIPIDGRILAVCDAFDAMTSDRPYRRGMSVEKAVEILNSGAGTYWDPILVRLFIENLDGVNQIRLAHELREPAKRMASVDGQPVIQAISE